MEWTGTNLPFLHFEAGCTFTGQCCTHFVFLESILQISSKYGGVDDDDDDEEEEDNDGQYEEERICEDSYF
jgi:hypothetical protein